MFPGHPWAGEEFGEVEYEWYLSRGYVYNVEFDLRLKPFIDFCQAGGHRSNPLIMKIAARLSTEFLPQLCVSLSGRAYPARYPAGYIRPVRPGADMLEHIAVREQDNYFIERDIRAQMQPVPHWFATRHPKIGIWLARHIFSRHEIKDNYALMVSRNPLRGLNRRIVFHGTNYRTWVIAMPFGDEVTAMMGAPHAFSNIQFIEPFLAKFCSWLEEPEGIPKELLEKPYRPAPFRDPRAKGP